jgi:hypothetical protein
VSISLKVTEGIDLILAAMKRHPNILFCVAAGNGEDDVGQQLGGPERPSSAWLGANSLPNLAVIAAAEEDGSVADYSDYGAEFATLAARADAFAPQPERMKTRDGYAMVTPGGTSGAAPRAGNLASRCLLLDPALTPTQLKLLLAKTSTPRKAWAGKVASGGVLNETKAAQVAALTGLIRGGMEGEAAADQLKLSRKARKELLNQAAAIVAA